MRLISTLVALLIALCAAQAVAQTTGGQDPEPETSTPEPNVDPFDEFESGLGEDGAVVGAPTSSKPIELMSRDELDSAGFEFGSDDGSKDSSAALLLSLTAGTVIHGIGHLYLGDRRTGWFLLGMEGVSVAMMISASTFSGLTENASPLASVFAPMLQAGIAGFVFSYLADILGVLTKDEGGLARNTSAERGVGFRARYGLLSSVGLPVRHVIDARFAVDVGAVYGSAATTQDVFLDLSSYRGGLGVRPFRGREELTFLAFEGNGEYLQWSGDGEFGRIGAQGRVIGSMQFGDSMPHMSEFAMGAMTGLGNHWYQIAPRDSTTFEQATSRLWVPFDIWASSNISTKLNLKLGYGAPELRLVAPSDRLLGIAHATLNYRSSSYGDISLRAEIGDGFALWLGGGLWFGR